MSITPVVALVLLSSGACMGLAVLAYARMPERRLHAEAERRHRGPGFLGRAVGSAVFSPALILALTYLLGGRLFREDAGPWWRGPVEGLAILAVYDVLYYLMHRYLFHGWSVLRAVHALHHRARRPTAIDSLFVHPVENAMGLGLLVLSTWIVGPVGVYAFGGCFFVYSWLNILVHAGVDLPVPYLGLLARKHDVHHDSMRAGNYASLSPLPDLLFGTAE
jgi:sterol desaturase/sphingolipid hydroxylase (fatty acid hydroxylase superfamily)